MKNFSLFLIAIVLVNCSSSDPDTTPICDNSNTAFQQIYNPLNTTTFPESLSGYPNAVTHEYTFNVATAATICSIGYQSQPTLSTENYTIEIYDTVTSTVVALITSTFSSTTTSYTSLSSPLLLIAGRSYKIKRHAPATLSSANGAGRCISNTVTGAGNVSFPMNSGNLTITDSDFYSGSASANDNNNTLPYIDIVFEQ